MVNSVQLAERFDIAEEEIALFVERWAERLQPFVQSTNRNDQRESQTLAAIVLTKILNCFGGTTGIKLARSVDVRRLVERGAAADCLFSDSSHCLLLLPREILAERLAQLRGFIERHRQAILRDGLAPSRFRQSARLDTWLGKLYPIRHFRVRPHRSTRPTDNAGCCEWLRSELVEEPFKRLLAVERDRADLIEDLTLQEAAEIEALRPRLFSLKVEVLREAEATLLEPDGRGAWDGPLKRMRNDLSQDSVRLLQRVDELSRDPPPTKSADGAVLDLCTRAVLNLRQPFESGGLTNLLELLWHVECERRLGRFHDVANSLCAAGLLRLRNGNPKLKKSVREAVSGWDWLATGERHVIDAALDDFLRKEVATDRLRGEFQIAVSAFHADVELCHTSASGTPSSAEWILQAVARHLDKEFSALEARLPSAPTTPQHDYIFRSCGESWEVQFGDGGRIVLPHRVGMLYIAAALAKPRTTLQFSELVAQNNQRHGQEYRSHSGDGLSAETEGVNPAGPGGQTAETDFVLDQEGLESIQAKLRQLEQERDDARVGGDTDKIEQIETEIEKLEIHVETNVGRRGRPRSLKSQHKLMRERVKKPIERVLDSTFKKQVPKLYEHLQVYLKCTDFLIYDPKEQIDWKL